MDKIRTYAWYWLACLELFSPEFLNYILKEFGSPEEIFSAKEKRLRDFFDMAQAQHRLRIRGEKRQWEERFFSSRNWKEIVQSYNNTIKRGIQFITKDDPSFPEKLKHIEETIFWLFLLGELPDKILPSIAVIGSRKCSSFGREVARNLSASLAEQKVQIISGLAEGIDGAAHMGALFAKEKTYAVLGSGIDVCYPKQHLTLYQKIYRQGGIISEYPPKSAAIAFHFPMRNRLIAGLCDGILVVEARQKSGSLITVDRGLEQGKEIYAVPGRIGDELSIGCNHLIQQGAKLVLSVDDIIEDLEEFYPKQVKIPMNFKKNQPKKIFNNNLLETEEKIVYASLSLVPKHIETICCETKMSVSQLYPILISLQFQGIIRETQRNYYMLNERL